LGQWPATDKAVVPANVALEVIVVDLNKANQPVRTISVRGFLSKQKAPLGLVRAARVAIRGVSATS